eukprot:52155_1
MTQMMRIQTRYCMNKYFRNQKDLNIFSRFALSSSKTHYTTSSMKEFNGSLVLNCHNTLGECPIWDYRTNMLYWIDIEDALFFVFDPKTDYFRQYKLPERVGCFALTKDPEIQLFAFENGPMFYNPFNSKQIGDRLFNLNHPEERANDGRCDTFGRFVFGGSHNDYTQQISSLYRINNDLSYDILLNQSFCTANSICFSNQGDRMYFSDTSGHNSEFGGDGIPKILQYDYYKDNKYPDNSKIFSEIKDKNDLNLNVAYDGSIVDADDYVWNAQLRGSKMVRLNPKNGTVDAIVNISEPYTTCAAFGGENLDTLYITTLSFMMDDEEKQKYVKYGGLYAIQLPFKGCKEPIFEGEIPKQ